MDHISPEHRVATLNAHRIISRAACGPGLSALYEPTGARVSGVPEGWQHPSGLRDT